MPKIGRNDVCPCNSGKKYKNCCINVTDNMIDEISSDRMKDLINTLEQRYNKYCFIDVTNKLNGNNYRTLQVKYYNTNIVMVAEKNVSNSSAFLCREPVDGSDIIVMHKGAYRTFYYNQLSRVIDSLTTLFTVRN